MLLNIPVSTIIEFIVGIIILIIVHELGHFIVCRLLNVEVEEFGLGFPPRAAVLFEARGTKFTLNWLFLGGFVRPKGQDDPSVEGGLAAASPLVRIAVLLAGSVMNLALALFLFIWIAWMVGKPDPAQLNVVEITIVAEESPAAAAGLQVGDVIRAIDDIPVEGISQVQELIYERLGQPLDFTYEREGQIVTVVLVPRNPPPEDGAIGILMGNPLVQISLWESIPAGFQAIGDLAQRMLDMLGMLVTGRLSEDQGRLVGFKGMFDVYDNVRHEAPIFGVPKLAEVLNFFASLSLWLGIINLAPIPALDGGRILFTLVELITRRRVPVQFETMLNSVVFFLLIALMLWINVRDFIYPIQIP